MGVFSAPESPMRAAARKLQWDYISTVEPGTVRTTAEVRSMLCSFASLIAISQTQGTKLEHPDCAQVFPAAGAAGIPT